MSPLASPELRYAAFVDAALDEAARQDPAHPGSKALADAAVLFPPHVVDRRFALGAGSNPDFSPYQEYLDCIQLPTSEDDVRLAEPGTPLETHIEHMWEVLRRPASEGRGSLIGHKNDHIAAGEVRYEEFCYWDSYFIMQGLAAAGEWEKVEGMLENFADMIDEFGHIGNGNRTYYMSRSQPPFFCEMVTLLAQHKGEEVLAKYLPAMVREHRYWMYGEERLSKKTGAVALGHAVLLDDTAVNRYSDSQSTPRGEMLFEDTMMARSLGLTGKEAAAFFRHIRAAAESGWDFSSRWLANGKDLSTIHTTDIVPIDLNCILARNEQIISRAYQLAGNQFAAERYRTRSEKRMAVINKYCWDEQEGFFFDYDFMAGKKTPVKSLAAAYALWAGVATPEQAMRIASSLEKQFLRPGGLATTLNKTKEQWDGGTAEDEGCQNGWAPLHFIAIEGLKKYGYDELAEEIAMRWMTLNAEIYEQTGQLYEKYDVNQRKIGNGGEYKVQTGFGWTNGVLLKLMHDYVHLDIASAQSQVALAA